VKTLTLEGFDVDKVVEIMNKYTKVYNNIFKNKYNSYFSGSEEADHD